MTGMGNTPITTNNSIIVSAFQRSLLHQLLLVLVVLVALAVAWNMLRSAQLRRAIRSSGEGGSTVLAEDARTEPAARRVLRVGFGLIWIFDGILQAQPAMPIGLANQVTLPAASTSPLWVQHLVNVGAVIWNDHPITAAVATVWIQVGIGIWLLVAPRGRWSQAGALVSVAWGLTVWSFGEAFGAIFAPGLTILFGAPGAVFFYCIAGGLVAMPERFWSSQRIGRTMLGTLGAFFLGMAILQAWPGRGFWTGTTHGHRAGDLVAMIQQMSTTPQPSYLSSWLSAFGSFDAAHSFAVNLTVVIVLAALGIAFVSGERRVVRAAVWGGTLFCLLDWVLIEDFGFFGGVGTDPNSMIPLAILFVAGYLALLHVPQAPEAIAAGASSKSWRARLSESPTYAFRSLAATGAVLVTLLGVTPMAFASTDPHADPIITEALNGTPDAVNAPAPPFRLQDEQGRTVSLSSLAGRAVALTFLDPVCTGDCPIIAQEFRIADEQLGSRAHDVEFLAIVANPVYTGTFFTREFDRQEHLSGVVNWHFLTGNLKQLSQVWDAYGIEVGVEPAGAMIAHSDMTYVIDASGHTRYIEGSDPGAGTRTTTSSFADLLDQQLHTVLSSTR